jgi:hypothetical protein
MLIAPQLEMPMSLAAAFRPDTVRYEGVRPIEIYGLRTFFLLMFLFVGFDSWSALIGHQGAWDPMRAAALCMFASYALLSGIGVLRPLLMLPIMVFMVFYKSFWLAVVAYPLWATGTLSGSAAEPMANIFVWVVVPILFVPWGYFWRRFVLGRSA